jgi:hypothetical protein
MRAKNRWTCVIAFITLVSVALGVLAGGVRAQDKAVDGGKAEEFKEKAFDIKAKDNAAITLTFPADKEATITVRSKKQTDVHLFILDADKKVVAKDDSPGPSCDLTFTPKKGGPYVLEIRNLGPGDNSCTLKVEYGKKGKG